METTKNSLMISSEEDGEFLPKSVYVTIVSMVLSAACYSFTWSTTTAVVLLMLILVHELGHVLMCRWQQVECSVPIFIPFLGAGVIPSRKNMNPRSEAWIGAGGPLLGGMGCVAASYIWQRYFSMSKDIEEGIMIAIFLNILNLLPVRPFDGGCIVQIVGKYAQIPGIVLFALLSYFYWEPLLVLFWLSLVLSLIFVRYSMVPTLKERIFGAIGYLLLLSGLMATAIFHAWLHVLLSHE